MNRSYSRDPVTESSLQHSIRDGVSYAVMTGVSESYFSAYAILLKASTQQIAWLASIPPLLASFWQLIAVWVGQRLGVRKPIIIGGALLQIGALLMMAVLPRVFPEQVFPLLLGCVILYYTGPNIGSPLWGSMMGSIVPENLRGRFFATRTRLSSIASFVSLITGGLILQAFDGFELAYYGFLSIFMLGVVARTVSVWHLSQIHDPPLDRDPAIPMQRFGWSYLRSEGRFLRFSLRNALLQSTVAISGPFVVVYLLRELQFSYLELTFNTAASVLVQFLVLNRWGRLGDIFGNRIIIRLTGFTIPIIPILWVLSSDYFYLLLVQALSGLVWSGFSLSSSNYVYDLTTQEKRAGLMAIHSFFANIAVFIGASFGGWLALHLPTSIDLGPIQFEWRTVFYGVFVISGCLRFGAALVFLPPLQEVRSVRRMNYAGLLFRVTRFSPISGVIYEIVGRRPTRRRNKLKP